MQNLCFSNAQSYVISIFWYGYAFFGWCQADCCTIYMSAFTKCMLGTVSVLFLFCLTIHPITHPSICPPIYIHIFSPPSCTISLSLPLILSLVLLNYLTSDSGLGCLARRRWRAGGGGKRWREKGKYGGARRCREPWVSRKRKNRWEGRQRAFIDSFGWYDWREWRQIPPSAFEYVRLHAPIDWEEKVTEPRGLERRS